MKLTFSELKLVKKALTYQMMASYSEKEATEMGLTLVKVEEEMVNRHRCLNCEKEFSDTDKQTFKSRPRGICIACFTTKA